MKYLNESGLLERAIETTFSNLDSEVEKIDAEIKGKEAELSRLQQTLDGFGDYLRKAALNGGLDRITATLATEQEKVDKEIQAITRQVRGLQGQKSNLKEHYQEKALKEKMAEALADFSKRCNLQKQQIIQAIVPKIIVHGNNRLEIKINPLFKKPTDDGAGSPKGGFKHSGRQFVLLESGESRRIRTVDPLIKSENLNRTPVNFRISR